MTMKSGFKVLMISTEYPPMKGGVGRYTHNLVKGLQSLGIETFVVSGNEGDGNYKGLSPFKKNNSNMLLNIVNQLQPDIVHVQMEHGLYGLEFNSFFSKRMETSLDKFYLKCTRPIVTTFHSSYDFKQWLNLEPKLRGTKFIDKIKYEVKKNYNNISRSLKYIPFNNLNEWFLKQSKAGIVFSKYMSDLIPGCRVIYHGSEPSITKQISKKTIRNRFGIKHEGRVALCIGFATLTKGWDIINKMDIPENWIVVINYSKNHFNREKFYLDYNGKNKSHIISLEMDYLSERDLSLLFLASDIVFLPYRVGSGSGVMFDGLAHGLPFLTSNLKFFREFANLNLGISVKKEKIEEFTNGLKLIDKDYYSYKMSVESFKNKLKWSHISMEHYHLYKKFVDHEINRNEILIK